MKFIYTETIIRSKISQVFKLRMLLSFLFVLLCLYKINVINQFPIDQRLDSSGFANGHISEIFDSWYNYGYYPVNNDVGKSLSKNINQNNLSHIQNEKNLEIRIHTGASIIQGDFLRVFYVLPGYLFNQEVSPLLMNKLIAIFSLIIFNITGLLKKCYKFTIIFSIFLVSTDYFIYENFFNNNIFGLPISIFLITYSSILISKNKKYFMKLFIIAAIAIFASIMTNIRTELSFIVLSCLMLFFFNNKFKNFVLFSLFFLVIFFSSNKLIDSYFYKLINKTNEHINLVGGVEYDGPFRSKHTLYHPLWMGLGDNIYGQELGHKWDDNTARLRVAELRPDIYEKKDMCGSRICKYIDEYEVYPNYAEFMDGYQETLKKDIILKIKENPKTFYYIYLEKIKNQFFNLSSIHINPNYVCINCEKNLFIKEIKKKFFRELPATKDDYINNSFILSGFSILIISLILVFLLIIDNIRKRTLKKLYALNKESIIFLVSSLPLSISAIIISDLGATYNSIFHFILLTSSIISLIHHKDYRK